MVILGLLTGGILAGQSLIRAAELRAVSTEYSRYVTAAQSFRDKYFALPGDMTNATQFWGRLNGNADCATNSSATTTTSGTCDGNGDGQLSFAAAASQSGEGFQFWRQLALAGLVEGSYSGLAGSGGAMDSTFGINIPKSKLSNAGWFAETWNDVGSATNYKMDFGNDFLFGAPVAAAHPYNPALKPEEAWNIDTKIDDGKPGSGKVIGSYWNNACATATSFTDYAAPYNLSVNTLQCALLFARAF